MYKLKIAAVLYFLTVKQYKRECFLILCHNLLTELCNYDDIYFDCGFIVIQAMLFC